MIHARLYSRPTSGEAFLQKAFSTNLSDRPLIAQVCTLESLANGSFVQIIQKIYLQQRK